MFAHLDLFPSLRRGQARRSAIHALRSLPAAQLRDIGVGPDQIDQLVGANPNRWESDRQHSAASVWAAFLSSGSIIRTGAARV